MAYKIHSGKLKTEDAIGSLERPDGSKTSTVQETMHLLLHSLIPDDVLEVEEDIHAGIREAVNESSVMPEPPKVRQEEVERVVMSLGKNKAPGPDRIDSLMLQNSWDIVGSDFTSLLNLCFEKGLFPNEWKLSELKVLLKSKDKDPSQIKSYRPICLLPVMGKVLERLIIDQVMDEIDLRSPISDNQFGFRRGRSTEDALQTAVSYVQESVESMVLGIFIDIAGAFDNVWWPYVLLKLKEKEVSLPLVTIIRSYFQGRVTQITTNYGKEWKEVTKGCPQGSVFGPYIWNIAFDDVVSQVTEVGEKRIAFADDLLILIRGVSGHDLERKANVVMTSLQQWCRRTKMEISTTKTVSMLLKKPRRRIGRGRRAQNIRMDIKYNGNPVRYVRSVKYLGIWIDEGLRFTTHTTEIGDKCKRIFFRLRNVARATYGLEVKDMTTIYKGLAESVLTYGASVWGNRIPQKSMDKLSSTQRQLLIWVTRAYSTVSRDALPVLAGVLPIDLQIKRRSALYCLRTGRPIEVGNLRLQPGDERRQEVKSFINQEIMRIWQERWDGSTKGRETHYFFPDVTARCKMKHIKLCHTVVQFITGHGNFRAKLHKFNLRPDSQCACGSGEETSEHVLFQCPTYDEDRRELVQTAHEETGFWPVAKKTLVKKTVFAEFVKFSRIVLARKDTIGYLRKYLPQPQAEVVQQAQLPQAEVVQQAHP